VYRSCLGNKSQGGRIREQIKGIHEPEISLVLGKEWNSSGDCRRGNQSVGNQKAVREAIPTKERYSDISHLGVQRDP
jgi:hypothetical protein